MYFLCIFLHVTRALQCFLNLFELQTILGSVGSIQSTVINFQHVLTSFAVFQSFADLFRESEMTVKLKITTKWTLKMLELGMVSSFHPHSMCKRVERVTAKTRRTSCTNWTISFGVSGFRTRTHLLHGHFNVFKLIWTPDYFGFSMQHSKRRHQFPTRSDIICCFSVIYRFV